MEPNTYVKLETRGKDKVTKVVIEYHKTALQIVKGHEVQVLFGTLKGTPRQVLGVQEIRVLGLKADDKNPNQVETQVIGLEKLVNSKTGVLDRLLRDQSKEDKELIEELEKFTSASIMMMLKKDSPFSPPKKQSGKSA